VAALSAAALGMGRKPKAATAAIKKHLKGWVYGWLAGCCWCVGEDRSRLVFPPRALIERWACDEWRPLVDETLAGLNRRTYPREGASLAEHSLRA
jgi:hypothetical protein